MDKWLINGEAGNTIRLDDRGLNYGDGLFETIAVRAGACRFLDAHLRRLEVGCVRLRIPVPDPVLLRAEVSQLAATVRHGVAKIIVTRGPGPRGYRLPERCTPTRIIGIQETTPAQFPEDGVTLRYCATPISRNPVLAGLKTLNRIEHVLARAEWDDPAIAEGLMCNDRGEIICGTMSNLFYGLNGTLVTPQLSECGINGIMRQQVQDIASERGIPVRESVVTAADLDSADEVFLTNALIGLWPVAKLAQMRYRDFQLAQLIRKGLAQRGVTECMA